MSTLYMIAIGLITFLGVGLLAARVVLNKYFPREVSE